MQKLFLVILTLFSTVLYSRETRGPASVEFQCDLKWETLSSEPVVKSISFQDSVSIEITPTVSVKLLVDGDVPKIIVTEKYSDDSKNYLEHSFQCDRFLNCKGSRTSKYEKKIDTEQLSTQPSGYLGVGLLKSREVFIYTPKTKSNFQFQYILYKNDKNQPMGLMVDCHE